MILRCEQENLFILPLDEQGIWHRYHHLFAEILRDRLARSVSDAEVCALHQRAAAWLDRTVTLMTPFATRLPATAGIMPLGCSKISVPRFSSETMSQRYAYGSKGYLPTF